MQTLEQMLRAELENQLTEMANMNKGTKEYNDAIKVFISLSNQLAKFEKASDDYDLKVKEIETNAALKREQISADKEVKGHERNLKVKEIDTDAELRREQILIDKESKSEDRNLKAKEIETDAALRREQMLRERSIKEKDQDLKAKEIDTDAELRRAQMADDRTAKRKELKLKEKEIETEAALRREQMLTDKKIKRSDRIGNFIGIAIPAGVTVWGMIKTLTFEEDGIVKSLVTKGLIQKLIPKM